MRQDIKMLAFVMDLEVYFIALKGPISLYDFRNMTCLMCFKDRHISSGEMGKYLNTVYWATVNLREGHILTRYLFWDGYQITNITYHLIEEIAELITKTHETGHR